MVSGGSNKKVLLNARKGIKEVERVRRIHEEGCKDQVFIDSRVDAELDPSGKVCVVEEQHTYMADCGCYVDSPYDLVGRCKVGLLVCRDHFCFCPRNARDAGFDPCTAPRLRACLKRCWWVIHWQRFLRWLVTPPKKEGESQ